MLPILRQRALGVTHKLRHFSTAPDMSSRGPLVCLWSLIGINTAVFSIWKYADHTISYDLRQHLPQDVLRRLENYVCLDKRQISRNLESNFVEHPSDLHRGRWWTPVTSAFSHATFAHFGLNMYATHSFGSALIYLCWPHIRAAHLVWLSMGSALTGSMGWLMQQQYNRSGQPVKGSPPSSILDWLKGKSSQRDTTTQSYGNVHGRGALGFSGAVSGIATACAIIAPRAKWQLIFVPIGIPAWLLALLYVSWDMYGMREANSGIAHAGHVGGALFGAVYTVGVLRKLRAPWAPF